LNIPDIVQNDLAQVIDQHFSSGVSFSSCRFSLAGQESRGTWEWH